MPGEGGKFERPFLESPFPSMLSSRSCALLAVVILATQAGHATAQDVERVRSSWLQEGMPEAVSA